MELSHFWQSVLHDPLYKTVFFEFWFSPPNAQNSLPQICTKSPVSRLVWQIDWRCLGLSGGFRGWPIQWHHAKCCGLTLVAMAMKFGLGAEIQSPTGFFPNPFLGFLPYPGPSVSCRSLQAPLTTWWLYCRTNQQSILMVPVIRWPVPSLIVFWRSECVKPNACRA